MKSKLRSNYIILLILFAVVILISSCTKSVTSGMVIFTEVPETTLPKQSIWDNIYLTEASLMAFDPIKKSQPVQLSKDFYSATDPQVSYDGKSLLFAAKKEAESTWQIWEMELNNLKVRQVTAFPEDCISPAYLPGNRLIFSRLTTSNQVKTSYTLFTGNLDGTSFEQVSFSPQSFIGTTVLKEGRALSTVQQVYPKATKSKLMVFRPDGTKLELLSKNEDGFNQVSKAKETDDGKILFVDNNSTKNKSRIVALNYSNPSINKQIILSGKSGEIGFVSPYKSGSLLLSKSSEKGETALYMLELNNNELKQLYKTKKAIIDAVQVGVCQRPRNLPSDVKLSTKTGLLMCQDINYTGLNSLSGEENASKVEILGMDSSLGIVDVEEDGSFYIKIDADIPFRIQTLTADGKVLKGPGSWYYIRPNERRGCVGCHTGPNESPFNHHPLSVRKAPVTIHK